MSEHFIENIKIRNFKCFEEFKAEGFGRVNLIGGKNNVGKTAFMEACYLIHTYSTSPLLEKNGLSKDEREELYFHIIKSVLIIEENRKGLDFVLQWIIDGYDMDSFNDFEIELHQKVNLSSANNFIQPNEFMKYAYGNHGSFQISQYRDNKYFYKIYKKNNPPQIYNTTFISPCSSNHSNIKEMIDNLKINNQYNYINDLLKEIFKVEKIDIIKNKVMLQQEGQFKDLNDFGDGIKHFLNIVLALLINKKNVVFLDEIENGIHYTNLDKLWEIILTISKQQNVQVFATTHSKECIESYARVAKELEDKEITFFKLGKNKEGDIKGMVYPYDWFVDSVEQEQELRGW